MRTHRDDDPKFIVYLLHIEPPIKHARHYVGSTEAPLLPSRLKRHGRRQGAALTRAALAAGSKLTLVKVWYCEDRSFERVLKRRGHHARNCALCNPALTADLLSVLIPVPDKYQISGCWSAATWEKPKRPPA